MITKKKITTLLTLLIVVPIQAQNLVPNPSFETLTNCPFSAGKIVEASPWIKATTGTVDVFNSCQGVACTNTCVPSNSQGNQAPRTGNGYAGFYVYTSQYVDYMEYPQVRLTSPLTAGQQYLVSFYVSLGESSRYATNSIGAHLSTTAINKTNNLNFSCCTPQIVASGEINDKSNWSLISGCYTATGGEEYITIGNFNNDAGTSTTFIGGTKNRSFYYLDDVSVVASCTLPIELLSFNATAVNNKESLLTWQTASEINNDYFTIEKSTDAINWEKLTTLNGAGNSSTTLNYQTIDQDPFISITYYRLKQTDFNGAYSYSNIEAVYFTGIDLVNVYPNPTEGVFTLNIASSNITQINLSVINSLGQEVIQQQFNVKKGSTLKTIDVSHLSSGVYQVKITTPTGEFSFKKFNRK